MGTKTEIGYRPFVISSSCFNQFELALVGQQGDEIKPMVGGGRLKGMIVGERSVVIVLAYSDKITRRR